jgi:hypothetical protein
MSEDLNQIYCGRSLDMNLNIHFGGVGQKYPISKNDSFHVLWDENGEK